MRVGTLGFADELLALVACPLWGVLSVSIGVRHVSVNPVAIYPPSQFTCCKFSRYIVSITQVCTTGYAIVALALVLLV